MLSFPPMRATKLITSYKMAAKGYQHADTCLPGPGVDLRIGSPLYDSCICRKCVDKCKDTHIACSCVTSSNMAYDPTTGVLLDKFLSNYSRPVFECNSKCTCTLDCINRTSQRGVSSALSVHSADLKGLGVFATKDIPKGTFVAEYTGEIVPLTAAKCRLSSLGENESCYLIVFREHFGDRIVSTCIDAQYYGNISRFMNHSCTPNLTMIAVRTDSVVPRLCLFSCKEVKSGEELSFSYFGKHGAEIDKSTVSLGKKPCLCDTQHCIGFLPLET